MLALVDCNNFYAACERVFNPKIENSPVIVLSNNDGCVIARSNEAKLLGIKMGSPAFKIKKLIDENNVQVFSTNFSLYGDMSKRVMNILSSEVLKMEVYSIDEAFLDFFEDSSIQRGIFIREKIKKWTGIPVSIGIAPNKTLSKVASHIAKKKTNSGVFKIIDDYQVSKLLQSLSVSDLWGIGRKSAKKLRDFGIVSAFDLRSCRSSWLRRNFSIKLVKLQSELNGNIEFPLELVKKRKKNICTSRSFSKDIYDFSILKEAVANYANKCAQKLRKEKSCCKYVGVFLNTNYFKSSSRQYHPYKTIKLIEPSSDSMRIVSVAIQLLKEIYKSGYSYKKAGVIVGENISRDQIQLSLFASKSHLRSNKINLTVDKINSLIGKDKVRLAVQGNGQRIKLGQSRLSPCYTTNFNDLLKVFI